MISTIYRTKKGGINKYHVEKVETLSVHPTMGDAERAMMVAYQGSKTSKAQQGTNLRSADCWKRYQNAPRRQEGECFMCDSEGYEVVQEFQNWLLIENNYPYDAIATVHHLLVPKRHVADINELTGFEIQERDWLYAKFEKDRQYDFILKNFTIGQSQPQHAHYHLITLIRD